MHSIHETLCLLVATGYLNEHMEEYEAVISHPKYLYTSCGRLASEAELVCLPRPVNICIEDSSKRQAQQ